MGDRLAPVGGGALQVAAVSRARVSQSQSGLPGGGMKLLIEVHHTYVSPPSLPPSLPMQLGKMSRSKVKLGACT